MRDVEMTDAALDEEIARALSVDPSPELISRIRRRVEAEPTPGVWTGSWLTWSAAASGAVVAAAIALVVARHGGAPTESVPPMVAHTIPYISEGVAPGATASWGAASPILGPERRAAPSAQSPPEILVDPREARALRSLIDDARSGRLDLTGFLDTTAVIEAEPIRNIYIAPIELTPLTSDEQGVPR